MIKHIIINLEKYLHIKYLKKKNIQVLNQINWLKHEMLKKTIFGINKGFIYFFFIELKM